MLPLLAQLVAPPLLQGPVRLPEPGPLKSLPDSPDQQQKAPPKLDPENDLSPEKPRSPLPGPDTDSVGPGGVAPLGPLPAVQGLTIYAADQLAEIFRSCGSIADNEERLTACAVALGSRLIADGYVSSRVFVEASPAPGFLLVKEGRLVEVRVEGRDERLNGRIQRLLRPLQGKILNLADVETQLRLLNNLPGVSSVRGSLLRLGTDPAQGVLRVSVEPGGEPWRGEISLRNDGSNGSGEGRGVVTVLKPGLLARGDTLLFYNEINASDATELGALITSLSYTYPLTPAINITGAFGYSRRNLVETTDISGGLISTSQFQGLGQLEWVFRESLRDRWSVFAGYSVNQVNTYLDNQRLPRLIPESIRNPRNGYLRLGISANGLLGNVGWGGNLYFLQGIGAATPSVQRRELDAAGIDLGKARAIGGVLSAAWAFAPSWQLNLRGGGQVAFQPLSSPMQFSLGSDVGLRGLPGQLISGDSGWLSTGEVVWTFWQKSNQALQLVPYIGAGGVRTKVSGIDFSDTVGSGGLLVRWINGYNWEFELGWAEQFSTNDNIGAWQDWALGKGVYAKLQYRF